MMAAADNATADAAAGRRRLIIAAFHLSHRGSHHLNELLGHRGAADALGMATTILVPRSADVDLIAQVGGDPVLGAEPAVLALRPNDATGRLIAYAEGHRSLTALWTAIERLGPTSSDLLLFPQANPVVIHGLGVWLARLRPEERPAAFVRFLGPELLPIDPASEPRPPANVRLGGPAAHKPAKYGGRAIYYFLACEQLRFLPGQDRIHFLAENKKIVGALSRVCGGRAFLMPMPMKLAGGGALRSSGGGGSSGEQVVYLHLNHQSKSISPFVSDLIREVLAEHPSTRFLVKLARRGVPPLDLPTNLASLVEVVPAAQEPADYLANLDRATIVALPYDAAYYKISTSGVFVEAVGMGKIVVVPSDTWMADEFAAGVGVGTTFEQPSVQGIARAVSNAIRAAGRMMPEAIRRATNTRARHSCQRYLETLVSLCAEKPVMVPVLRFTEDVDFTDPLDSRQLAGPGWGVAEASGSWTIDQCAELSFALERSDSRPAVLYALVQPFLAASHRRLCVTVEVDEDCLAQWIFDADGASADRPRWCEAPMPPAATAGGKLTIRFRIDQPKSPSALGVSDDSRMLGFCLRTLVMEPLAEADVASDGVTS